MFSRKQLSFGIIAAFILSGFFVAQTASADSVSVDFENPPYATGTVNAQDGWSSTGAAGSGCAMYDHAVDSSFSTLGFGLQSLRISNAVTSGCFGDQTFSKSLIDEAGEVDSTNGGMSGGTRQNHFEAQFDFASTMPDQQPGLSVSVSPDRGDGSRMSYLRFVDDVSGIDVFFDDVSGVTSPVSFDEVQVADDLSRTVVHTAKFVIDYVDGPSNDVVKIYIDNVLVHTGTTWENYFRFDAEASAEQTPRTTDNLIFRTGGGAVPANADNGFLFDNLSLLSGPTVVPVGPCDDGILDVPSEFGTIQAAVDFATNSCPTIRVAAGTYPELVTVNKTLTLNGAQAGVDARTRVVSVPSESVVGIPTGAFQILADNAVIDGFTVTGVLSNLGAGVHIDNTTSGHNIRNNIITGNVMGVYLNSSGVNTTTVNQNLISNNNAPGSSSGNGIYSDQGLSNAVISNNTFTGAHANASIILVSDVSSNISITGNSLTNDGEILLVNTNGATISNNTITNSLFHGIQLAGGNNNVAVSGNVITGNNVFVTASGIRINGGPANGSPIDTNVTITNNSLTGNKYGLNVNGDAATGVTANFNDLSSNSFASLLYSPSLTPAPTLDAQNNWWGCAAGPQTSVVPVPTANPCGLLDGNVTAVGYNPWLATLNLAGNNPVTGQIINSDGFAVGFGTGLQDKFTSSGANAVGEVTAEIDSANTASYNFNFIGPVVGDTTINDMVLFAGQNSTLTGTLVINTPTPPSGGGGGGGGGSQIPTPTPAPEVAGASIVLGDPANLAKYGLKEGDLISAIDFGDPDVYIINAQGYKRLFLNPIIFGFYGHLGGFAKVKHVSIAIRDAFPTSGLFRSCSTGDPKVYGVEVTGEDTGTLHWINLSGAQAMAQDPEFFKKVFCIDAQEFNWYAKSTVDFTVLANFPVYSR